MITPKTSVRLGPLILRALLGAGVAVALGAGLASAPAAAAGTGTGTGTGTGSGHSAPTVSPGKPAPPVPAVAPGVTLGSRLAPKAATALAPAGAAAPQAWTVSLTASSTYLWQTRTSTLTATANADVGPTVYYLRIFKNGTAIASCATGKTCAIPVTEQTATTDYFDAEISDAAHHVVASDPNDPFGLMVTWHAATAALSASVTTLPVGAFSTLTATASDDVGPSPYFVEIFDATTATFLKQCSSGTSCSVQVSQGTATTHAYRAFVSLSSGLFPPPSIVATSSTSYLTWTGNGYHLSLTGPANTTSTATVTATSSIDVSPTPYYLQIFNEDTGVRLAVCGGGTTCAATLTPSEDGSHLVAFISALDAALPPASIQASANVVTTTRTAPVPS